MSVTGYSIGRLSRAAGVPTSTVRYYERVGLLRPAGRSSANYRVYGQSELERLVFIRAAQAIGFALEDISTLVGLRDGALEPCPEVQDLIEERLAHVSQRLKDLRHIQRELRESLRKCRESEKNGYCEVIDTLSERSQSTKRGPRR